MARTTLEQAIDRVHAHFRKQCGGHTMTMWHVLEATENIQGGHFVVKCVEHCYMETDRTHEVWVDATTGEIVHQHRIDVPQK